LVHFNRLPAGDIGLFFIVGSARSGTTLLRTMLNAHPQVAVPPESRFIVELYDRDEVRVDSFFESLAAHPRFQAWELPVEAVAAELPGRTSVTYAEAVSAAYHAYARARSKERWGDKTPRYIKHIPFLSNLYPEAPFVHLIRDGRDVALSYADVPFGPKNVAAAARLWASRVSEGLSAGRKLPPGRYLELHYEELVDSSERQTRALCDFLGLPFAAEMLEPKRAHQEVLKRAAVYNPRVTGEIARTRSWVDQMPPSQIELFEAVAGDVLAKVGYERVFGTPGAGARLKASLGRAGLPVGRLRRKRESPRPS
jgi:Sulfotransferase family